VVDAPGESCNTEWAMPSARERMTAQAEPGAASGGVCVFAPSTIVTVTIEHGASDDSDGEIHFHAGGQGFWVGRMLGRLGVATTLCTVFGGETGVVAEALAAAEPIDVRAVHRSGENGTWIHDRRSGEREVIADVVGTSLGRHETDELVSASLVEGLRLGRCVLTGPHGPGLIASPHYERLARDLKGNGAEVIVDLSGEYLRSALSAGVDFAKVSDEDLTKTRGFEDLSDPVEAVRLLCDAGARHAVVTRGELPAIASINGAIAEVRVPDVAVVDHRGAGDAFTAAVAASRVWAFDWHEAIRWGAAAGSLTVIRRGLATADRHEIHRFRERIDLHGLP